MAKEIVSISKDVTAGTIAVQAPYHAEFVAKAKNMGGKWQSPRWVFDLRNEELVRKTCRDCYGTDGETTADTVTLKVSLTGGSYCLRSAITLCGRTIARAYGRDSGARLGDGIVLLEGEFISSGSMKNWATEVREGGAIVLIHDFPRVRISDAKKESESITVLEVIDEGENTDMESLVKEKERLLARIAEINQIIGGNNNES